MQNPGNDGQHPGLNLNNIEEMFQLMHDEGVARGLFSDDNMIHKYPPDYIIKLTDALGEAALRWADGDTARRVNGGETVNDDDYGHTALNAAVRYGMLFGLVIARHDLAMTDGNGVIVVNNRIFGEGDS